MVRGIKARSIIRRSLSSLEEERDSLSHGSGFNAQRLALGNSLPEQREELGTSVWFPRLLTVAHLSGVNAALRLRLRSPVLDLFMIFFLRNVL
jgi:hypothetical protein